MLRDGTSFNDSLSLTNVCLCLRKEGNAFRDLPKKRPDPRCCSLRHDKRWPGILLGTGLPPQRPSKIRDEKKLATKLMKIRRKKPGPGQESAWDYPRPPRVEDSTERVRVVVDGVTIADSTRAKRVLETSHPPVYYVPPDDVRLDCLQTSRHRTWCEWKGEASFYSVAVPGKIIENAAWYYPAPTQRFADLKDYVAFYPSKMDACYVDEEKVQPQQGDFYGGWITSKIVGPFKGAPGTLGW